MLNAPLVEEFRRINAEGLTGSLTVTTGDSRLSFFFENGQLCLLDFNNDKELLLARQYRVYNKIGAEIESLVCVNHQQSGARVQDFLLQQQLVTNEEVEQVTRTLVEDALCHVFGTPHQQLDFNADATYDDFDLQKTAVKLRIQVDMLLRMVESRVAERDSVMREIPDWNVAFALVEGAPDSSQLNEMERHVLHFIDGRKTVVDIATAMRESCMNIACYLISLRVQGFITPSGITTRRHGAIDEQANEAGSGTRVTQPAVAAVQSPPTPAAATTPTEPIPATAAAREEQDFEIYRAEPEATKQRGGHGGSSMAVVGILGAVLLVVLGIGWLVIESEASQEKIDRLQEEILDLSQNGSWQAAAEKMVAAREEAGNDRSALNRLDDLRNTLNAGFDDRLDLAADSLEKNNLDGTAAILADMPSESVPNIIDHEVYRRVVDLRARLDEARAVRVRRANTLADQVEDLLERGEIQEALTMIEGKPERLVEESRRRIAKWRNLLLEDARSDRYSITRRREMIAEVQRSGPDEDHQRHIAEVEQELASLEAMLDKGIAELERLVASGDYIKAEEEIARWRARADGHPKEQRVIALSVTNEGVRTRLQEHVGQAAALIRQENVDSARFSELSAEIGSSLQEHPAATNRRSLERIRGALKQVMSSIAADNLENQITRLQAINTDNLPESVAAAISRRRRQLQATVQEADDLLADAKRQAGNQDLDQAINVLRSLVDNPQLGDTAAASEAAAMIPELKKRVAMREAIMDNIKKAMIEDDVEGVGLLLREADLSRPPLVVRSVPEGAEVIYHDQVLGTTPLIVAENEVTPMDAEFTIRMDGYRPVTVTRTDATAGGWRILRELKREPVIEVDLDSSITSVPELIDDVVYLVGNRLVFAVHRDGSVDTMGMESGSTDLIGRPLNEPVYAPVTRIDGGLFVTTRDHLAIEIRDDMVRRLPLKGRSNHALEVYESPNILDRKVVITTGLDGVLHGNDPYGGTDSWHSEPGAAFAMGPHLVGDAILTARQDGTLLARLADTGQIMDEAELPDAVVGAWPTTYGLAGFSQTMHWSWTPGEEPVLNELPHTAQSGSEGVYLSTVWRIMVRGADGAFTELTRIPTNTRYVAPPMRWGEHVVMCSTNEVRVFGPRPFTLTSEAEFLAPCVADGHLVLATTDGQVRIYHD